MAKDGPDHKPERGPYGSWADDYLTDRRSSAKLDRSSIRSASRTPVRPTATIAGSAVHLGSGVFRRSWILGIRRRPGALMNDGVLA